MAWPSAPSQPSCIDRERLTPKRSAAMRDASANRRWVSLRSCGSIRLSFATAMFRPSPTLRHETSSYGCKLRCLCRALVPSRNSAAGIKIADYIECEGLEGGLSILAPVLRWLRMSAENHMGTKQRAPRTSLEIVTQSRSPANPGSEEIVHLRWRDQPHTAESPQVPIGKRSRPESITDSVRLFAAAA
jgi:hypothetical protein